MKTLIVMLAVTLSAHAAEFNRKGLRYSMHDVKAGDNAYTARILVYPVSDEMQALFLNVPGGPVEYLEKEIKYIPSRNEVLITALRKYHDGAIIEDSYPEPANSDYSLPGSWGEEVANQIKARR